MPFHNMGTWSTVHVQSFIFLYQKLEYFYANVWLMPMIQKCNNNFDTQNKVKDRWNWNLGSHLTPQVASVQIILLQALGRKQLNSSPSTWSSEYDNSLSLSSPNLVIFLEFEKCYLCILLWRISPFERDKIFLLALSPFIKKFNSPSDLHVACILH